ncbi:MAG TPA: hypothetical protein VNX26_08075 [Candidatus Acidoferrum sp.]|jgi:hypothetical protein|nr:hypothetical protein [Candidatus Acidoferrum sp.]
MKYLFLIAVLAFVLAICGWSTPAAAQAGAQSASQSAAIPAIPVDQGNDLENSRKARKLLDQALQALGGQAYLNVHDIQQEGRTYSFYHGQPTSNGVLFWRFVEFPDKERIELTKQRDVAYLYAGNKAYELTYKGPHPVDKKDLEEYLRRRKFSLDTLLRTWINDPSVALFYDGNALAGNLPAQRITLINAKNEAVSLFFDIDTHLPIKKSYTWRDPVDKERNVDEEIYDNYRLVQGVMTPWGFTRYFNGDMQTQRFVSAVHINQGLDQAMFDPNSGYDPNKAAAGKH